MIGASLTLLGRASTVALVAASRSAMHHVFHPHLPSLCRCGFSSSSGETTTARAAATALGAVRTRYLLRYEYVPDVLERRGPYREGHLGLAGQLLEEGKCLSGGPTGKVGMEVPTGALFVFTDEASARAFVEGDPYVSNGIVTGHSIEEWTVVLEKES